MTSPAAGSNDRPLKTEEMTLDQMLIQYAARIRNATYEAVMEVLKDKCTCGCNFGDGCLCVSDNSLRAELRQSIAKIFEKEQS